MLLDWTRRDPREGKTVITTIDVHVAGEPLRIVTGGLPNLPGDSILVRRRYLRENLDHLRRALMHEPRGHFDMYGCVLTPPVSPDADLGVLFLHNEGYSTMCGHGIIGLVTALLETGAIPTVTPQTLVNLDTPAGLVRAAGHLRPDGKVDRVSFRNVPSYLAERDVTVEVPGYGELTLDIAFGGAFYAILPAKAVGTRVSPENKPALITAANAIKTALNSTVQVKHPTDDDLSFLYGVIFTDEPEDPAHHSRNACVFAASELDRSPTGTGVSARLAAHHARGELKLGESILVESILGRVSVFEGRVVDEVEFGPHRAIVPEISGQAFLTGRHEFLIDPDDPLSPGFLL